MSKKAKIIFIIAVVIVVLLGVIITYIYNMNNVHDEIAAQEQLINTVINENGIESIAHTYCEEYFLFSRSLSYSHTNGDFSAAGTLYIDESIEIEKLEIKMAMANDYIQYKENYEDYIIKTIDITNKLHALNRERNTGNPSDNFINYSFSVSDTMTEETNFNAKRGLSYALVLTFNNGQQAVVYSIT